MNRWHGPGRPPGSALGPYKAGPRGSSLLCPGREGCTLGNRTLQQGKNRPMVPQAPEQRSRCENRPMVYLTLGQHGCEHQEAEPIRHSRAGEAAFPIAYETQEPVLTPGSREGILAEVTLELSFKRCAGTGRGHKHVPTVWHGMQTGELEGEQAAACEALLMQTSPHSQWGHPSLMEQRRSINSPQPREVPLWGGCPRGPQGIFPETRRETDLPSGPRSQTHQGFHNNAVTAGPSNRAQATCCWRKGKLGLEKTGFTRHPLLRNTGCQSWRK